MRHGSLFSAIGGFDLAAQWMGWTNVFQVEIDSFCQQVLAKNFPEVERYGDIKTFNGTKYRGAVDIISGGFPCQPFSTAGKRKGTKDDRYIWPEMLRVIREIQPAYVVGENVYGLVNWSGGLVFEQVCADLENEGYQVQPVILPACAVNAPHRRDRVWFIAYAIEFAGGAQRSESTRQFRATGPSNGGDGVTTNSPGIRWVQGVNWDESEVSDKNGEGNFWQDFPTQSPLRDGNDGLPSGLVRSAIAAGGNAIVPQVAFEIFKAIESINQGGGR